ncbi:uncharacterized protein LOC144539709 [Centroberyx gerrardi]
MDLFKAIFTSSSSDKSSSSSEEESEDEEDEKDEEEGQGKADLQPPNLFNITSSSTSSSSGQQTAAVSSTEQADPGPAPSCQNATQEEEEFGPKLPPPSSALSQDI